MRSHGSNDGWYCLRFSTCFAHTEARCRVQPRAAQRRVAPALKPAVRPCPFRVHELRHDRAKPSRGPAPLRADGCQARSAAHGLGNIPGQSRRPVPKRKRGRVRGLQDPATARRRPFPRLPMPRQRETGTACLRGGRRNLPVQFYMVQHRPCHEPGPDRCHRRRRIPHVGGRPLGAFEGVSRRRTAFGTPRSVPLRGTACWTGSLPCSRCTAARPSKRILAYRMSGKRISRYDQHQSLTAVRREDAVCRTSPFWWHALRWPVRTGR